MPAIITLVLGLGLCGLLAGIFHREAARSLQDEVRRRAADRVEVFQSQILRSMEVLHAVAALFEAHPGVTRETFRAFVDNALARQPELQALAWDPLVPHGERTAWEARAREEGFTGFTFTETSDGGAMVPAGDRPEYYPVYFLESLSRNLAALGYDVGSEASRRSALEEARDTGKPCATAPIRLAQEPGSQQGFVVFFPLYKQPAQTVAQRRAALQGFATAVFRIGDLISLSLGDVRESGVALTVLDQADGETLYTQEGNRQNGAPEWRATVDVAGRHWTLLFEPTVEFDSHQARALSWLTLAAVLGLTLLLSRHLWSGAARAAELQTEVAVRKDAEAAADAANQAKSEFLANMSHEIRTPLHAILGYAQILDRDTAMPPFHRDAVATILNSGEHLLRLIDEILDLSKIDAGRMELETADFDLARLVEEIRGLFLHPCEEKGLGFRLEPAPPPEPVMVHGDEGKVRQVLINLLSNAVKFTERGLVTLRWRETDSGAWRFEVEDTGIGIPPALQESIFDPFQQGKGQRGGTGLGLAIARRQVTIMGGAMDLESTPGKGSCFAFTLQLPAGLPEGHPDRPAVRRVRRLAEGHRVRALVVDDIRENREVLAAMLNRIGGDVVLAEHGRQALEVVKVSRPDVVFLDMRLPEVDGMEAARQILADSACGGPKVVATSASALTHERESFLQAGCDDFVAKPFRAERIYDCLHQLLGVEFEYEAPPEEVETGALDLAQLVLPADLADRLSVAAELHSSTVLKTCLEEMKALGPTEARLAQHLRGFLSSYDMKTIQRIVAQIQAV